VLGLLLGLALPAAAVGQTTDFESAISSFETQDIKFPPPRDAVLITGSSTIRLWTGVRNDLVPLEVIPRGFGGSTADDLLFYMDRIVFPYAPRAVVIYEGDHDLQLGMTPPFIVDRMTQILARIGTEAPETRIYLISVKPSPKYWGLWPQAVELNQMVADLCALTPRCIYIDTTAALLGSNGKFIRGYYRSDNVHFNAAGYAAWLGVVEPILMLGEAADIVLPELRSRDLGTVDTAGFAMTGGGTATVFGSGNGIAGSNDEFHYAWRQLIGNGQITARIASQSDMSGGPMAGIMLREQLTEDARYAFVFTAPGVGAGMKYRTSVGGASAPDTPQKPGVAAPYWLRLVRKSGAVTCYLSANGISWSWCGKVTINNLKKTVYVGLAVSSAADGALASAAFDNVWIHGTTAFPPPSPAGDVTAPTMPTDVAATAIGIDQIQLAWSASTDSGTGVVGYRVYRDGSPTPVGTTTANVFVDSGLDANSQYTYSVSAYDGAFPSNESLQSDPISANAQAAPPPD
jgi:lysophospholipase L1-like esterase